MVKHAVQVSHGDVSAWVTAGPLTRAGRCLTRRLPYLASSQKRSSNLPLDHCLETKFMQCMTLQSFYIRLKRFDCCSLVSDRASPAAEPHSTADGFALFAVRRQHHYTVEHSLPQCVVSKRCMTRAPQVHRPRSNSALSNCSQLKHFTCHERTR